MRNHSKTSKRVIYESRQFPKVPPGLHKYYARALCLFKSCRRRNETAFPPSSPPRISFPTVFSPMDDRDRAARNILRFIKGAIMKKSRASSRITSGRLCRKRERSNETSPPCFLPLATPPIPLFFLPSFLPASSYFPPVFRLLETLPDQVFRAEIKPELRERGKKICQPVCSPSGRSPFTRDEIRGVVSFESSDFPRLPSREWWFSRVPYDCFRFLSFTVFS